MNYIIPSKGSIGKRLINAIERNKNTILAILILIILIFGIVSSRKQRVESRDLILRSNDSLKHQIKEYSQELKLLNNKLK